MTWLVVAALAVAVTILGPLPLLITGVDAWPFVTGAAGLAAACCYVSRLTWRRWPDDEWFAVWLFVAAVIWTGSGWLGIAIVTV
jgi:hypothetical protein